MRSQLHLIVLLALLLCVASSAWGDDQDRESSGNVTANDRKARELYEEGVRRYNIADYDAAIEAFRRAYLISRRASLLYNIAQAYRQKGPGSCGQALRFYRSYLRERPNASDRRELERRINEMEACARNEAPSGRATTPPSESGGTPRMSTTATVRREQPFSSAPSPARPLSRWRPLAVGGAGVVLLTTAAVLYGVARSRFNELRQQCPCPRETWENWQKVETSSYALFVTGGVGVAAGLTWWLIPSRRSGAKKQSVVIPSPGGLAGTF